MTEAETIMRRKAKRIAKAREILAWLKADIEKSAMIQAEKEDLMITLNMLKKVLKNDDKEENQWNS